MSAERHLSERREHLAARPYVSPRDRQLTDREFETRAIAYGLRLADGDAIRRAAQEMAPLVESGAVFVPMPDSAGSTSANRALAEAVAALAGGEVRDVVRRAGTVESSRLRRLAGAASLAPEAHLMVALEPVSAGQPIYLVDNVSATGNTIAAAREALGGGVGLVFAHHQAEPELDMAALAPVRVSVLPVER